MATYLIKENTNHPNTELAPWQPPKKVDEEKEDKMDNTRLRELAGVPTKSSSTVLLEADGNALLKYDQVIDYLAKKMKSWPNGGDDYLHSVMLRGLSIVELVYGVPFKQVSADATARYDELSRTHPPTSSSWAKGYDTRDD